MTPLPPPTAQPEVFSTWRSVLTLSPRTRTRCRDVHRLHQLVLNGFRPPGVHVEAPAPEHVLFAAGREPASRTAAGLPTAGAPVRVLVQAPVEPDWQPLLDTGALHSARSFRAEQRLEAGAQIDVGVLANPVVRTRKDGRRRALRDPGDCGDWLARRLAHGGLQLTARPVIVGPAEYLTGSTSRGEDLTLVCRELTARATVRDPKAAREALLAGIGPGKAFGCGLLLTRSPPGPPRSAGATATPPSPPSRGAASVAAAHGP
ncbi:type I-E CRISPR-associated protein Cas6/Cse3/CasE [Streptomyces sp. BE20]|uniref:type I-E CRISPR-associated protein Cas6/Cse3/CasE n=1 Tax=Streptomyces sp. BE20 TaxID=3002525 RepID=UPI002E77601A|nr:type I-E CRISPR-associated protein Cas6/Cse3/CasE [Streptomyces sp. BE20]MEE1823761.1 type I-E CRISPR-associated protein Cas6/Cse3/CasE [Streptomyces sp. BE20]